MFHLSKDYNNPLYIKKNTKTLIILNRKNKLQKLFISIRKKKLEKYNNIEK
jgi:hypothetical protein